MSTARAIARELKQADEAMLRAKPLADAGEYGNALVDGSDVADKFLNDNGLANAGPAVGPNLAALHERCDQELIRSKDTTPSRWPKVVTMPGSV